MSLKTDVCRLLDHVVRLCEGSCRLQALSGAAKEMQQRLEEPLRVAVVGIMKAGKSTFMNALMGKEIVDTGSTETTYTVGWFRYGKTPSLEICFRDGRTQKAPFDELHKWSVRAAASENERLDDVRYVVIYYPSEVLKKMEFIDTPGLNSIYGTDAQNTLDFLSINGHEDTVFEASRADAVIYAFSRSMAGYDKEILDAFHAGASQNSSPINSIGILTKVDATGIWDLFDEVTPPQKAAAVAEKSMENPQVSRVLFSVYPVCAKPVEGTAALTEADWALLEKAALLERDELADLLYDAAVFCEAEGEVAEGGTQPDEGKPRPDGKGALAGQEISNEDAPDSDAFLLFGADQTDMELFDGFEMPAGEDGDSEMSEEIEALCALGKSAERTSVMNKLSQYGILEVASQLAAGRKREEITGIMQERCGIKAVGDILEKHFGNRTFLIKTQYIFSHLRTLLSSLKREFPDDAQVKNVCAGIFEEIDALMGSVQTLNELKILQMYYNRQVSFLNEEEKEDFLRVTGEYGRSPEERLDMPGAYTVAELKERSFEKMLQWRGKAGGFMLPRTYVEAARIIARSYENMYYHLSALLEE